MKKILILGMMLFVGTMGVYARKHYHYKHHRYHKKTQYYKSSTSGFGFGESRGKACSKAKRSARNSLSKKARSVSMKSCKCKKSGDSYSCSVKATYKVKY